MWKPQLARRLNDIPIRFKAFGGATILIVSLILIGTLAIVLLNDITDRGQQLSASTVAKQTAKEQLIDAANESHLALFRYIAWASNSVNSKRLEQLRSETSERIAAITRKIERLAGRDDLSPAEADVVRGLSDSWSQYAKAALENVEVGSVDSAMGTMMLGGSDDNFQQVAAHLGALTKAARLHTKTSIDELRTYAVRGAAVIKFGILVATLVGLLVVFFVARSIVQPIRSVTEAMRQISFGRLDFKPRKDHAQRKDEIGQMVSAIGLFCESLSRAKEEIDRNEVELRAKNLRFDAALSNMSQGLCLFDGDRKLVVSNDRYAEIYGFDPETLKPGTPFPDILLRRAETDELVGADPNSYILERLAAIAEQKPSVKIHHLQDGRTIAISHRPMEDGGWLETHDDITDISRIEARIAHMAHYDGLTDLPNRTLFRQRLDDALTAQMEDEQVAVLCLDIDRFKGVNDTLGHHVGDRLLKAVSARLGECVREIDTLARLGGDEFAIVAPAVFRREEVASLAERIIEAIRRPFNIEGHQISVGTSVGIAFAAKGATNSEDLVRNSDIALYQAKAGNHGCYRFFEAGMADSLRLRRQMETDLRRAIAEEEIELHFQPIVDAASHRLVAFESLLRWTHPVHGSVPPQEFVGIAEETGDIHALGEWILRQSCLVATQWPDDIRVTVNLSPLQFAAPDLIGVVKKALSEAGLPPTRLELEITESVLLHENKANQETLHGLRRLGVSIALDDFGTGYSSLSYLRKFPFDRIKIDRLFLTNFPGDPESAAIVKAVVDLATTLGMKTTAEGVESADQLECLTLYGCSEAQGFYFSAARPAADIPALIARLVKQAMERRSGHSNASKGACAFARTVR